MHRGQQIKGALLTDILGQKGGENPAGRPLQKCRQGDQHLHGRGKGNRFGQMESCF